MSATQRSPGPTLAILRRAGVAVLDALLPPSCLSCHMPVMEHGSVCADCFRGLHLIAEPMCRRCGVPFRHGGQGVRAGTCATCVARPPAFAAARAAYAYDDTSARLILPLKHGDRTDLARHLARRMAVAGEEVLGRAEVLVPVPLHWRRLLARRYNQAGLLARHLGRAAGRPVLPDALVRTRATRPLGGLGAAARTAALAGAFRVRRSAVPRLSGRRVLLVDDVLTSGATADACARELLDAGAATVDVLAAARVPDPRLEDGLA
ncbi:ComF family protein [Roseomonas sp. CCTCC AB2023176]|uniref:ComF family protein n=1 Tax=Roseomonas sp. CCTCC AB2023176 TaxID=3342640 RepID=UPI0035D8FB57